MIRISVEQWEVDTNPKLTYPIVINHHIREMTRDQILRFIVGNPYYFTSTNELRTRI